MEKEILNDYFMGDTLATSVWKNKYRHNNESPKEFKNRIINEFNRIQHERLNQVDINKLGDLSDFGKLVFNKANGGSGVFIKNAIEFSDIIPAGSVLSGIGTGKPISLSNCFFNGQMEDNIESIWDTTKSMAQIGKRRGGTSTDLSKLRPRGAKVHNSSNTSSGAVEFLNLIDSTGKLIGQDGRKMAIMVTLDVMHPDIEEFITIKNDLSKVTNANLSIKLNDDFIKAVKANEDYILRWPCDSNKVFNESEYGIEKVEYNTLYETEGIYWKKVKAKEIWDKIINSAHQYAEPGILNWDRVLNYDPTSVYDELKAKGTNPCSELPLGTLDSCRLICVNLYNHVMYPFKQNSRIDYDNLYKTFYIAQVIGDLLVDLELEAIDKILDKINPEWRYQIDKNNINPVFFNNSDDEFKLWWKIREIGAMGRRTGIETTGYADMLAAIGVEYGNVEETEHIYKVLMTATLDASIDMSILFGAFPLWDKEKECPTIDGTDLRQDANDWYKFISEEFPEESSKMFKYGRRNSGLTTIGPCGSISLILKPNTEYPFPGMSSGVEPVFSLWYIRRRKANADETPTFIDDNGVGYLEYKVLHPRFKEWIYTCCYEELKECGENTTPEDLDESYLQELAERSPYYNQTAEDIDYHKRVETQALIQKYITASISSTINLPADVTRETVSDIYLEAFDKGCKGVTVYRDGSRSGVLVKESKPKQSDIQRPEVLDCKILHFKNDRKDWVAFVGLLDGQPYEIFTGVRDIDVFPIPSNVTSGKIIRVKYDVCEHARYDLVYKDAYGFENRLGGLSRIFNKEYWNYARFVSALLRGSSEVQDVVRIVGGLEFDNKSLNNWQSGVIRALKEYIPDGTEVKGVTCPDCGGQIIYENGCHICKTCGHSTCV